MRPRAEREYKMPTLRQAFNKIADKLKLPRVEQLIDSALGRFEEASETLLRLS